MGHWKKEKTQIIQYPTQNKKYKKRAQKWPHSDAQNSKYIRMKIRVTQNQSFLKMERTKKDLELSLLQCRGSLAAQRVTIGDYIDQEHWGHFKTNSHTTWIKHTPQDKQTHKCAKIIIAILEMQYIKCIIEGTFTFCGMLSEVGPNNEWMGQYIVTGFFCWGFGFSSIFYQLCLFLCWLLLSFCSCLFPTIVAMSINA